MALIKKQIAIDVVRVLDDKMILHGILHFHIAINSHVAMQS